MIKIFISNRIEKLAETVSKFIGVFDRGWESSLMAPEKTRVLLVQSASEGYLKFLIAQKYGICANISFEGNITTYFENLVSRIGSSSREQLLTYSMAFSALYDHFYRIFTEELSPSDSFKMKEARELALSRAQILSGNIIQYMYRGCMENGANRLYQSRVYGKYLSIIIDFYAKCGKKVLLPNDWLNESRFDKLDLPDCLYIFDPAPLTPFEVMFLRCFGRCEGKYVFICAFSPTEGLWHEMGEVLESSIDVLANGDLDEAEVAAEEAKNKNRFVSVRSRKIARRISRSLYQLLDENSEPNENFELSTLESLERVPTNLEILQNSITTLESPQFGALREDCESISLNVYTSESEEVCAAADKIVEFVRKNSDASNILLFDDICLLIPVSKETVYAPLVSSELTRRNIPYNIRSVIQHPANICYSAFEAFVSFMMSNANREDVMRFAFHEGIATDEERGEKEQFLRKVQDFGIYNGFGADKEFSWDRGIRRLTTLYLEGEREGEPAIQDEEGAVLFLRHYHRVHAMFSDLRTTQSARLSYDDWQRYLIDLFGAWLRADVPLREPCMKTIYSQMTRYLPKVFREDKVGFDAILPFLHTIARNLRSVSENSMFGGVQVRSISESVMSRRCVFILGQSQVNFPSPYVRTREFEMYSNADIDEYAWNKWFLNAKMYVWLSATLSPKEIGDGAANSLTPFMRGLNEVFVENGIAILQTSVSEDDLLKEASDEGESDDSLLERRLEDIGDRKAIARRDLWEEIRSELKVFSEFMPVYTPGKNGVSISGASSLLSFEDKAIRRDVWELLDDGFYEEALLEVGQGVDSVGQDHGSEAVYPTLSWRVYSKMLKEPNAGYRQYMFGIDEYSDVIDARSPLIQEGKRYAPLLPDLHELVSSRCIRTLLLNCFLTNQLSSFELYFDKAMQFLQKEGLFPGGIYAASLKRQALSECARFQYVVAKVLNVDESWFLQKNVHYYRVVLKSTSAYSSRYEEWLKDVFVPEKTLEIDYENEILLPNKDKLPEVLFRGELCPIIEIDGKCYVVNTEDRVRNSDRRKLNSYMTCVFMKLICESGIEAPKPTYYFPFEEIYSYPWEEYPTGDKEKDVKKENERLEAISLREMLNIASVEDCYRSLQICHTAWQSGKHELEHYYTTTRGVNAGGTPLNKYMNQDVDTDSGRYWDEMAQDPDFAVMLRNDFGLIPKAKKRGKTPPKCI